MVTEVARFGNVSMGWPLFGTAMNWRRNHNTSFAHSGLKSNACPSAYCSMQNADPSKLGFGSGKLTNGAGVIQLEKKDGQIQIQESRV